MASTTDWKQLPDSVVDPITLEPINELRVEPSQGTGDGGFGDD